MAKAKVENLEDIENVQDENAEEKKAFKARAKQCIKYGGKHIKIDEEFEAKECDLEELRKCAEIEEGE